MSNLILGNNLNLMDQHLKKTMWDNLIIQKTPKTEKKAIPSCLTNKSL